MSAIKTVVNQLEVALVSLGPKEYAKWLRNNGEAHIRRVLSEEVPEKGIREHYPGFSWASDYVNSGYNQCRKDLGLDE